MKNVSRDGKTIFVDVTANGCDIKSGSDMDRLIVFDHTDGDA